LIEFKFKISKSIILNLFRRLIIIDANIINSVLSAVKNTFQIIAKKEMKVDKPRLVQEIQKDYDVVTNIGFTGVLEGNIIYSFSEKEAISLVNEMMQGIMNINELDDMAISAIGEFGNMIAGAIATHLEQYGYLITVTPPSVMRGKIVKVNVRGTILLFPLYVSGNNEMDLYFVYKETR